MTPTPVERRLADIRQRMESLPHWNDLKYESVDQVESEALFFAKADIEFLLALADAAREMREHLLAYHDAECGTYRFSTGKCDGCDQSKAVARFNAVATGGGE